VRTRTEAIETAAVLEEAVARLRRADPGLRAVILFGSAAWAEEMARDLDLLILTEGQPEESILHDLLTDLPLPVDLVIRRVGEPLGGLAPAIRAGRLIWGDPRILEEALSGMPVPSPEEVWQTLAAAEDYARLAQEATSPLRRDRHYRTAFNTLFEAARLAVMIYLGTDEERWGRLSRALPPGLAELFRRLIHHLHIRFWYEGEYPKEQAAEAFRLWKEEVQRFIERLLPR
jgi:predicted nucleotidyltransferase